MILATDAFEMRKAVTQITGTVVLQEIRNRRWAEAWWSGNDNMHMIDVGLQRQKNESMAFTAFGEQFFGGFLHLARENLAAIFRNPHEMLGDGVVRPACFTCLHPTLCVLVL